MHMYSLIYIVGYVRLVCLFIALMIMNGLVGDENPGLAVAFYMASVLLDEVDGMAARKFKQGWYSSS